MIEKYTVLFLSEKMLLSNINMIYILVLKCYNTISASFKRNDCDGCRITLHTKPKTQVQYTGCLTHRRSQAFTLKYTKLGWPHEFGWGGGEIIILI